MNIAYIDNQNLYMATHYANDPWDIDMKRFRIYLKDKYDAERAYLFMGAFDYGYQDLYQTFMRYGYILDFRDHGIEMKGHKKGNVDTDIVFSMMRDVYENKSVDKIVLVSGDGDYYRTIKHLIGLRKVKTVLLPSHQNASSLYKMLPDSFYRYLDEKDLRKKIAIGGST